MSSSLTVNSVNVTGITSTGAISTTRGISAGGDLTVSGNLNVSGDINSLTYNNGLPNVDRYPELSLPPARDMYEGMTESAISLIEGVIATMTPEEISLQLLMGIPIPGTQASITPGRGSIESYLTTMNTYYEDEGTNRRREGLPLDFNFGDHLRGLFSREMANAPTMRQVGQTFDETVIGTFYEKVGQILSEIGCTGVYGPQADYGECISQGRATECYGEDSELIYRMTKSQINSLQSKGVAACVKHFIEGMALRDNTVGNKKLREDFLGGFASMKDALFMMAGSYNGLNATDCNLSKYLITTIARQYLQFNGVIMSDATPANAAALLGTMSDIYTVIKTLIEAGTDLFILPFAVNPDFKTALIQYMETDAGLNRLKDSVRRVFIAKYKLKMFPQQPDYVPRNIADPVTKAASVIADTDFKSQVLDCARKSIVLLKNDGVLPLNKSNTYSFTGSAFTSKSIQVGNWAWDGGYKYSDFAASVPEAAEKYSIKDGLALIGASNVVDASVEYSQAQKDEIIAWAGSVPPMFAGDIVNDLASNVLPKFTYTNAEISNVVSNVASTDTVVVCLGFDIGSTHQVNDALFVYGDVSGPYYRLTERNIGLEIAHNEQLLLEALLDAGKNVVIVYCGSQTQIIPDRILSRVSAFIYAGHLGSYGGQVIAEALYGDINPSGHLSISWPKHSACYPCDYRYQLGTNYQWFFDGPGFTTGFYKAKYDPAFKFAQGLSYNTNFVHSNIATSVDLVNNVLNVSIQTTNNGSAAGKDLVAIYAFSLYTNVFVTKDSSFTMIDFKRVDLNAGQTRTVTFAVPLKKLSFVPGDIHQQLNKKLLVPTTKYLISDDHNQPLLINSIETQGFGVFAGNLPQIPEDIISSTTADESHILGSVIEFTSPIYFDEFVV